MEVFAMNLKQLEYFLELNHTKNITKAAENLYISQQGLSSAIMRLEKELGIKLFQRTANGINTTPEGLYFLEPAMKITSILGECQDYFHSNAPQKKALKIASSYGVLESLKSDILIELPTHFNNIDIDFIEYPGIEIETNVEKGNTELGFAIEPININKFDKINIFSKSISFICHQSHPLAHFDSIDFIQLKNQKFICFNNNFKLRYVFNSLCNKAGFKPSIGLEVGELSLIPKMVERNLGIGFIFSDMQNALSSNIKVLNVNDICFEWSVCLIYKKDTTLSKPAKSFISFIENKYETK